MVHVLPVLGSTALQEGGKYEKGCAQGKKQSKVRSYWLVCQERIQFSQQSLLQYAQLAATQHPCTYKQRVTYSAAECVAVACSTRVLHGCSERGMLVRYKHQYLQTFVHFEPHTLPCLYPHGLLHSHQTGKPVQRVSHIDSLKPHKLQAQLAVKRRVSWKTQLCLCRVYDNLLIDDVCIRLEEYGKQLQHNAARWPHRLQMTASVGGVRRRL